MTANTKKNVITASLGNAADSIFVSISNPALSVFDFSRYVVFSRLF